MTVAAVFLSNDNIKVKVPMGMSMRQVAQKTGASMEFGCRIGDCTTCIASVDKGMQHLSTINQKEIKALKILNKETSNVRLMCQCTVESIEGEIIISYL